MVTLERYQRPAASFVGNFRLVAFLLLYTAVSVACGLYYCSIAPSPDQSLYDYIAWQGIKGIPWYTGSFDVSWPGPFLIEDLGSAPSASTGGPQD